MIRVIDVDRIITTVIVFLVIALGKSACAAPFVEQVNPPVFRRGSTNRVTLRGTDLDQAVGVWVSSPVGRVQASVISSESRQSVLEVAVPADIPMGIHGLRLATKSGLSNVHLILVDELPVTFQSSESTLSKTRSVKLPACIAGRCLPEQVDHYLIQVAAGQTVGFEVVGSRFGKNYDPLVTIRDRDGRIVVQRDNDPGLFYDCRFTHRFESAGEYLVEVRDSRFEGDDSWNYVLRIGNFPAANVVIPSVATPGQRQFLLPELSAERIELSVFERPRMKVFWQEVRRSPQSIATWVPIHSSSLPNHTIESEPNDNPENATVAAVPGTLNGVLNKQGDRDYFKLNLKKGQALFFTSMTREIGSAADLELVMYSPEGRQMNRVDHLAVRRHNHTIWDDARFVFYVYKDGEYRLMVRDLVGDGGPSFAYRVDVAEPKPSMVLEADVSRLTIPQNSWQPVPIKVTRDRLVGPINLKLIGAPAGVSIEPAEISADKTEVVCRVSASAAVPTGIWTLEIQGNWTSKDGKSQATAIATVHPMIDRQRIDKDRRLYSMRDNQLRLPPSVRTRIALMVTPPAPFSIDLPNDIVLLTKYQTAAFPIVTKRESSQPFDSSITFTATGGQIGSEAEERDNVFVRIPDATADQTRIEGVFYNRINTSYQKARVDLSATAQIDGHDVTLIRTFALDVRSAFKPAFEPSTVMTEPGKTATVKLLANRTSTYDGEVTIVPSQVSGFDVPENITIPPGQSEVELSIPIPATRKPGRVTIRFESTGMVGRYEEHLREPNLTIDIKKPKVAKKTK